MTEDIIYLLQIKIINLKNKIISPGPREYMICMKIEDAAITVWQKFRILNIGYDLQAELFEININQQSLKKIELPRVEFNLFEDKNL